VARELTEVQKIKLDALVARFRERLTAEWPGGEADVTQIEDAVSRIERECLREVTQEWIREHTGKREGNRTACPCGHGVAVYSGQYSVELVTAFGRVRAARAYFYCRACRDGHCPQDRAWRIGTGNTTPTVQGLVSFLAATQAYTSVPAALKRVRPQIHLGVKTVELIAHGVGAALAATYRPAFGPAEQQPAVAVDGVIVAMRSGPGKEARVGVVYEPDWEAGRDPKGMRGLRKEYHATFGDRDAFMREMCGRAKSRARNPQEPISALGDGAQWIWDGYTKYLPIRTEILDFYHAADHVHAVATAMFPKQAEAATAWWEEQRKELLAMGPARLLIAVQNWKPKTAAAREIRRAELGYLYHNQHRMQYPDYLRKGYPISTGAIEGGGCRHLVRDRMDGSGMRWKVPTAEPMLHLRAALLTDPDLSFRDYATFA
jgi:hypothetical protein